jgi:hypothetical protein
MGMSLSSRLQSELIYMVNELCHRHYCSDADSQTHTSRLDATEQNPMWGHMQQGSLILQASSYITLALQAP